MYFVSKTVVVRAGEKRKNQQTKNTFPISLEDTILFGFTRFFDCLVSPSCAYCHQWGLSLLYESNSPHSPLTLH